MKQEFESIRKDGTELESSDRSNNWMFYSVGTVLSSSEFDPYVFLLSSLVEKNMVGISVSFCRSS